MRARLSWRNAAKVTQIMSTKSYSLLNEDPTLGIPVQIKPTTENAFSMQVRVTGADKETVVLNIYSHKDIPHTSPTITTSIVGKPDSTSFNCCVNSIVLQSTATIQQRKQLVSSVIPAVQRHIAQKYSEAVLKVLEDAVSFQLTEKSPIHWLTEYTNHNSITVPNIASVNLEEDFYKLCMKESKLALFANNSQVNLLTGTSNVTYWDLDPKPLSLLSPSLNNYNSLISIWFQKIEELRMGKPLTEVVMVSQAYLWGGQSIDSIRNFCAYVRHMFEKVFGKVALLRTITMTPFADNDPR